MQRGLRVYLLILIFLAIIVGFISGATTVSYVKAKPRSYEKLSLFTKVLHLLESSYVEKVEVKQLIYGGIKGMLEELDPHSAFLTPENYKDMKESTTGKFGGLGIEITKRDNILTIITPLEDTPAWKAGLKSMDQIIKIDGESTADMDLQTAVTKMRGTPGTKVTIAIKREGEPKLIDFTITRKIIKIQSVKMSTLPEDFGYIRISTFNENTITDAKKAISKLKKQTKNKLKGLLLDLRNNPGGLLDQAVAVSDMFIEKGIIVSVRGRDKEKRIVEYAKPNDTIKNIPLVVLVNQASASASEIVAGALQDHKRAIIIGQKTFGKGSVQTLVELDDKSAIKYTMARYYTPNGTSIQAKGIEPDIEVLPIDPKIMEDEMIIKEEAKRKYGEAKLKGHFEGEDEKSMEDRISRIYDRAKAGLKKKMKKHDIKKVIDLDYDYQANLAFNYLRIYALGQTKSIDLKRITK